jgi:hypothetical protein
MPQIESEARVLKTLDELSSSTVSGRVPKSVVNFVASQRPKTAIANTTRLLLIGALRRSARSSSHERKGHR